MKLLRVRKKGGLIALFTILVLFAAHRYHSKFILANVGLDVPVEQLPMKLGDWTGTETQGLDLRSLEILQLTRYVKREYVNSKGDKVLLYLGYWAKQTGDYQAAKHSPALCLPSSGWGTEFLTPQSISFPEGDSESQLTYKRVVGDIRNDAHLFYYWFFTGEQNYSEEWRALLTISLQKFFTARSDGGIVEVSARLRSGADRSQATEESSRIIKDFVKEFYPALRKLVRNPQTIPATDVDSKSS